MILRLGALLLILFSAYIAVDVLLPEESKQRIKNALLTDEQKALYAECEKARQTLRQQQLPTQFASVEFLVRDERLKKDPILRDLNRCFPLSKSSKHRLEVELFSSDYGNESSDDLQVQISAIEVKSKNKVAEVGFRLDHKAIPKTETPEK